MTTSNFKQPVVLLVSGIPSDCSLMSIGNVIENIERENVKITHISLIEESLPPHGLRRAEIKLADKNHVNSLVKKVEIEFKHGDETYPLKITKKRPQKPTNYSNEEAENCEVVGYESDSTLRVVTWLELLQTNEDIFCGNDDRCILVTDLSPNITVKMLQCYFECTELSGGGRIKNIIRIRDGILIIFYEQVAMRVLQQTEHHIKSEKLKIFLKPIPSLSPNSFLIEGEFKDQTNLMDYLKQNNFKPNLCKQLNQYLFYVILDQTSESWATAIDLETKMDDTTKLKVQRCCNDDCIKLKNVQKLSSRSIQRAIEERNCMVTVVKRSADKDAAFVFFADYKDVCKLEESINCEPLIVDDVCLKIILGPFSYEEDELENDTDKFESNCNDERNDEEIISENSLENGKRSKVVVQISKSISHCSGRKSETEQLIDNSSLYGNKSYDTESFKHSSGTYTTSLEDNTSKHTTHGVESDSDSERNYHKQQSNHDIVGSDESTMLEKINNQSSSDDKRYTAKLSKFTLNLDVDANIIDFLIKTNQLNELAGEFESIVRFSDLQKSPKSYSFRFKPMKNQENRHYEQNYVEEQSFYVLKTFFSKYQSKSHAFSEEAIAHVKNEYKMKKLVTRKFGNKSISVLVDWTDETIRGRVVATGLADDVDEFLEFLKQECKNYEQKLLIAGNKLSKQNYLQNLEYRQSNKAAISWFELLQKDEKLFDESKDRCILVKNFPSNGSESDLQTCLGYSQRTLESIIEKTVWLQDGFLIVFKNDRTARSLLLRKLHIGKTQLKIFLKQIPPILQRRFIIEVTSIDPSQIINILKRKVLSDVEFRLDELPHYHQRFSIILKSHSPGANSIVEKIKKEKRTKDHIKTFLLCKTDCLKISNIEEINNDRILKALEANDCEVTLMQRPTKDVALVYVADFEDIRKLVKSQTIIDGKQIKVKPYYAELEPLQSLPHEQYCEEKNSPSTSQAEIKENKKASQQVCSFKSFKCDIEADSDALELVCSSIELKGHLDEELVGLATMEFIHSQSGLGGKFTPVLALIEDFNGNQKEFEQKCRQVTKKFFRELNPQIHLFTSDVAKRIQEIYGLTNQHTRVDEKNMRILIKWEQGNICRASLIGLAHQVKSFRDLFLRATDNIVLPTTELEIAKTCGIVCEAEKKYLVQIHRFKNGSGLVLYGIKHDVTEAKIYIATALKEICRTNIAKCLSKPRCIFLKEVSTKLDIATKVKNLFLEKNIQAVLQFDESITLVHTRQSYQSSIDTLESMIQCEIMSFSEDFDKLKKDSKLENLENTIKGISGLKLIVEGYNLTLVGLQSKFPEGQRYIAEYREAISEKKELLKFDDPHKTYLCEFMSRLDPPEELNDIDYHENEKGIQLEGRTEDIECVSSWMKKKYESLKTDSQIIEEPWKMKYLLSEGGKQFLKTTSEQSTCWIDITKVNPTTIKTTKTEPEFQRKEREDFRSVNTHSKYPSALIPETDVTIRVIKNDITRHKVDVFVNASNEELELRSAGVSGSILRNGGHRIQEEMDDKRWKIGGRLHKGRAVTTGAGNLPFKKIIHVSGPVWRWDNKDESSKCLMESIKSCLIEAEKHNLTSISIPAISCGVFGGDVKVCAKLIVQSIVEHFTKNTQKKRSSLHTIDLIELFNDKTIDEFSKQVKSLVGGKAHEFASSTSLAGTEKQVWPTSEENKKSGLQVSVEAGDILENNGCDVILNTAGPEFDLTRSQLSVQLMKKAGKSVEDEVRKLRYILILDRRSVCFTESGKLPCKKIAHLIIPIEVKNLWKYLLEVFELAEEMKMSSIAIPAIGTGNQSFKPLDAATAIKTAIETFEWKNPKNLKKIKLIVYEGKNLDLFQKVVDTYSFSPTYSHSSSSKLPWKSSSTFLSRSSYDSNNQALETKEIQNSSKHLACNFTGEENLSLSSFSKHQSIKLMYCSHTEENIVRAKRSIRFHFENKYQETKVTDIAEDVLTKSSINLRELENKHAVRITKSDKPGNYALMVSGLSEDVAAARKELRKLVDEENQVD